MHLELMDAAKVTIRSRRKYAIGSVRNKDFDDTANPNSPVYIRAFSISN